MGNNARVIAAAAVWLAAMVIGIWFTTGGSDSDNTDPADQAIAVAATAVTDAPSTTDDPGPVPDTSTTAAPTTTAPPATTTTSPPETTTTSPPTGEPATSVVAALEGGTFSLGGIVPDDATANALVESATIVYGPNFETDFLIDPNVEAAPWLAGATQAVTFLPIIGEGAMVIDDAGATVSGTAPNEEALANFAGAMSAALGGAPVESSIEVTNLGFPSFNARRQGNSLVLTGTLASRAARNNIAGAAVALYGEGIVDDQLAIGEDLDTPFWTYTMPGVLQLLAPFPDYEIDIANGVTGGSLNAGANFENDSAVVSPETEALLGVAEAILTRDPTLGMVVAGHTDSIGDPVYNQQLSERRAQATVDILIASGIEPDRVVAVGYGAEQPIAPNDSSEGRALNRRVEFVFGPLDVVLAIG